jgi:hypothetical protein
VHNMLSCHVVQVLTVIEANQLTQHNTKIQQEFLKAQETWLSGRSTGQACLTCCFHTDAVAMRRSKFHVTHYSVPTTLKYVYYNVLQID